MEIEVAMLELTRQLQYMKNSYTRREFNTTKLKWLRVTSESDGPLEEMLPKAEPI